MKFVGAAANWMFPKTGAGRLEKSAVTNVLFVGMMKVVVGEVILLMPAPVQPAKNFPLGALLAVNVIIVPAPKFPLPLPLLTVSK